MLEISPTLFINPKNVDSVFADEEGVIIMIHGHRHLAHWPNHATEPAVRGRIFREIVQRIHRANIHS